MKKIILDTNFLLIPAQFRIDIFTEIDKLLHIQYEFCIVDRTLAELDIIIEKQKGKDKEAAKIAKTFIERKNITILKTTEKKATDDLIVDVAGREDCIVATQDQELKRKLKDSSTPLIIMRQKKKLELQDPSSF